MRKLSPSPHLSLPWSSDDAEVRYAVLALAILALLLVAARYASHAPAPAEVPVIELLSDPEASEQPVPTKPRKQRRKPKLSSGGAGGAAPVSAPTPSPAGDDESDEGDDD